MADFEPRNIALLIDSDNASPAGIAKRLGIIALLTIVGFVVLFVLLQVFILQDANS